MALFGFEFCQSLHARTIESVLMVVVKLERQPYSVNVFPIKKTKSKIVMILMIKRMRTYVVMMNQNETHLNKHIKMMQ